MLFMYYDIVIIIIYNIFNIRCRHILYLKVLNKIIKVALIIFNSLFIHTFLLPIYTINI